MEGRETKEGEDGREERADAEVKKKSETYVVPKPAR